MKKKIRSFFVGSFFVVILLALGLLATQEIVVRIFLGRTIDEHVADMRAMLPIFMGDQKLLETNYTFKSHTLNKNAGPLLNPIVTWENALPAPQRDVGGQLYEKVFFPEATRLRLHQWENFPAEYDKWDLKEYNPDWINQILAYDHWDLEEGNPIHKQMFDDVLANRLSVWDYLKRRPIPVFSELVLMVKVVVAKGLQKKIPDPAFREIRHLARLCYSTERSQGAKAALEILDLEQKTYDWLVVHKYMKADQWQPPGLDALAAGKRTLESAEKYVSLFTPDELFDSLFKLDQMKIGRCIAMNEATLNVAFYEGNLRNPLPFERNYEKRLDEFRQAVMETKAGCRLKSIRMLWERGLESFYRGDKQFSLDWRNLHLVTQQIPFLRNAAGLVLAASGKNNLLNK